MNIDLYERLWMWGTGGMLTVFFAATAWGAVTRSTHPPSHVETINPAAVLSDPRFTYRGVWHDAEGGVHVTMVGLMFVWLPD